MKNALIRPKMHFSIFIENICSTHSDGKLTSVRPKPTEHFSLIMRRKKKTPQLVLRVNIACGSLTEGKAKN